MTKRDSGSSFVRVSKTRCIPVRSNPDCIGGLAEFSPTNVVVSARSSILRPDLTLPVP